MKREGARREEWRAYAQVVAKVWADPEFEKRLRADPAATLREAGLDVPLGDEVVILPEDDATKQDGPFYFILPPKPARLDDAMSIEQMQQAMVGMRAMGTTHACGCDCEMHACGCDSKG